MKLKLKLTTYDENGNEIILNEYEVSPVEYSEEEQIENIRRNLLALGMKEQLIETAVAIYRKEMEMRKTAKSIECTLDFVDDMEEIKELHDNLKELEEIEEDLKRTDKEDKGILLKRKIQLVSLLLYFPWFLIWFSIHMLFHGMVLIGHIGEFLKEKVSLFMLNDFPLKIWKKIR